MGPVKYISTRGTAPVLGFEEALLAGLARDGGLYVPDVWPVLSFEHINSFAGQSYSDVAYQVMSPFVGDALPEKDFRALIAEAYAGFEHQAVAPLVQIGSNDWILELFHGPTLAFKDFAMQILSRLMDRALKKRGQRATIIGATSGDTGGAAIEAFRGCEAIDIFILHPHGRVSDVQRRQMTTASEANVHNIALQGTFDDCQALVKAMFNDLDFRDRMQLAGVNSINWGRIMAQIVYYFTAAVSLGAPHRAVSFSVPTGNFGDIFAGFIAQKMGLPIEKLIIATNVNDILTRTVKTGRYEPLGVVATQSPSMDIQVSSNFERLLFEISGRNSERICSLMADLKNKGLFILTDHETSLLQTLFEARRVTEEETARMIRQLYETNGYIADPHTAVGLEAAGYGDKSRAASHAPVITLATAHPAKFPDTVERVTGISPLQPRQLTTRLQAQERFTVLENQCEIVKDFIEQRAGL